MDQGIVNTSYPFLAAALDTPVALVGWVGIAYQISNITFLTIFGRLADLVGRRRIYLLGYATFLLGSLLSALAPNLALLIPARLVTGIAAAMLISNAIALLGSEFPRNRRGLAIGITESSVAVGIAIGPIVSGLVIEHVGWRGMFFVHWPAGLAGLLLGLRVLREPPRSGERETFDFLGAATFGLGIVGVLYGLTAGSTAGWNAPLVVGGFFLGAVLLSSFFVVEQRVRHPMIALSLFRHPVFASANLAKIFCYMAMFTALFALPFYFRRVLDFAPAQVGLAMLPAPIALLLASLTMGPLSDRVGSRVIAPAGMLLGAIGCLLLVGLEPVGGYLPAFVALLVLVFGLGSFIVPNDSAIVSAAPPERLGVASGILAMTRSLGQVLGLAIAGTVLTAQSAAYLAAGVSDDAAFLAAFHDLFKLAFVICLIGATAAAIRTRGRAVHRAR